MHRQPPSPRRTRFDHQMALLVVALVLQHGRVAEGSICEAIRIRLCQSMPYNITQFPNLLHHSTQTNANLVLDQFQPLVESNCSQLLVFYLCSLFVPVCPIQFRQEVIPPCRRVCLTAKTGCEPVLARFNLTWPIELACDDLPLHETGVCITPEAIDATPASATNSSINFPDRPGPKHKTTASCDCRQDGPRTSPRRAYMKHSFDYVIRATYLRTERIAGNLYVVSVKVTQVIKRPKTAVTLNKRIGLWTENQCICYRFTKGNQYLVMGFEDGQRRMLTFSRLTIVEPWKKNWPKYIKKWESRAKKNRRKGRTDSKKRDQRHPLNKPNNPRTR